MKTPQERLDAAARTRVPDDINLYPRLAAQLQRKTFMQTLRARPALLVLIILFALSLFTGVAYAVGRSLGYIPGIGMVEQGAPLRVLAEPASVTRDEITLTVKSAVLSPEKTVIVFTIENVPQNAYLTKVDEFGCSEWPRLRLPDGNTLQIQDGGGIMNETRVTYPPTPATVNEATFVLPCISNTMPGRAPENWELPLRFIPAPPDMTVVPVVDVAPPTQSPATQAEMPFSITQAMQVGEETVIVGTIQQPQDGSWIQLNSAPHITDANGQDVFKEYPTIEGLPNYDWGLQFQSGGAYPFTLRFDGVKIAPIAGSAAEFEFDAGENPQPLQQWLPNLPIQIGGRTVKLVSVQADGENGYNFSFESDPDVNSVSLEIVGYSANGGGGGGGEPGQFSAGLSYSERPKGKLRIRLSHLMVSGPQQSWSLPWMPENAPAATPLYGIAINVEKFIPLDDGYYLLGRTTWTDKRVTDVRFYPKAYDESGKELVLAPAHESEIGTRLEHNQWLLKLSGKAFQGAVTIKADMLAITYQDLPPYTLDLRPMPFTFDDTNLDRPYKTGLIPLELPGITANAFLATYIHTGEQYGFEIAMEADPRLQGVDMVFDEASLEQSQPQAVADDTRSYRDQESGLLKTRVLTASKMNFPLVLHIVSATLQVPVSVDWMPPAAPSGAPLVYSPDGCLNLETWKQASRSKPPLPAGLSGTLLVMRTEQGVAQWLMGLDGSNPRRVSDGFADLSPDGSKLAYNTAADINDPLTILDLATGVTQTAGPSVMSPRWSPDGRRVAFLRQTDKGFNIFVTDVDGKNQRALTDGTEHFSLNTWTPDGKALIIRSGTKMDLLDVSTGNRRTLFTTNGGDSSQPSVKISPDGQWVLYIDSLPGDYKTGVYVARLDGSEKRLLVQMDDWPVDTPVFSPDGQWIIFTVTITYTDDQAPPVSTLLNLSTCQAIPLPHLGGQVEGWVP